MIMPFFPGMTQKEPPHAMARRHWRNLAGPPAPRANTPFVPSMTLKTKKTLKKEIVLSIT
jgi:hypothetical protein